MIKATRETARRRATRERLVSAALDLFGRFGIDATSVEQLCEAAGFSRGAFYSNFETKDDVCAAVARFMAEECVDACLETLDSATSGADLGDLLQRLFQAAAFGEERQRTMVEMQLRAAREPALAARLRGSREDMTPLLVEVIERAAAQACFRFTVDVRDLLTICEALYFSPLLMSEGTNVMMMSTAIEALVIPKGDGPAQALHQPLATHS